MLSVAQPWCRCACTESHCISSKPACLTCAQARSAEVVSLSREVAELMERTEAAEAAADRYEAKHRTSKAELQQAQASCAQQSSEIEQLSEALAHEQAAAGSSQDAVEQLSSKLSAVQVQGDISLHIAVHKAILHC